MKKLTKFAALMLAALTLAAIAPPALALECAPISVKQGSGVKVSVYGLYRDGSVNRSDYHEDITGITIASGDIAEVFTRDGLFFIRGLSVGSTRFTVTTSSGESFTGLLSVFDWNESPKLFTFERGRQTIVLPAEMRLLVGEGVTFHSEAVSWKMEFPEIAGLSHNRGKIRVFGKAPGVSRLAVTDAYTGVVADITLTVEPFDVTVGFPGGKSGAVLRAGEKITAGASFSTELNERQMRGCEWRLAGSSSAIELDASSGLVTAKKPGTALLGLYLPLTGTLYGGKDGQPLKVEVLQ